jgi:FixJ family two-component response regulator
VLVASRPEATLFQFTLPPNSMGVSMTEVLSVVFVVVDDPSIRRAIKRLVESAGLRVEGFGSAQEFLRSRRPDAPSCLVLDVRLPGISGLDFQRELRKPTFVVPSSSSAPMATFR